MSPVRGGVKPGDRAQCRGLARPVGADERDALAFVDGQRHALERLDVAVEGMDLVDLEQRHQTAPSDACGRAVLLAEVGLDHARVVAHRRRVALGDLLAVVEHRDLLGDAHHDLHVVLDEQDGEAPLVAQALHERGEGIGFLGVHARRGLVEQQQLGVGGQRPGDLDASLVAVGEVDGQMFVHGPLQADVLQRLRRLRRAPRFSSLATHGGRRIEPNSPAFMRECWPTMTFSSAVMVPKSRMFWKVRATPSAMILSGRPAVMFGLLEAHAPERRLVEPGEDVEERRLARAVGPDERDDRPPRDLEARRR